MCRAFEIDIVDFFDIEKPAQVNDQVLPRCIVSKAEKMPVCIENVFPELGSEPEAHVSRYLAIGDRVK